jgi:hypothetical protein
MLAFFAALEPLRLANQLIGWRHHPWRIYTTDGCPARASCGMSVPADSGPEATADRDALGCVIVISGFDPWPQPDRRLKNWLRGLDRRGASLGAVDTGAFLLAAAHLVGSVRTSVHRSYEQHFRRQPGSDRHLDYSLVGPRRRFPPMPRRPTAREPPSPGSGIGLRRHRPGANEQTPCCGWGYAAYRSELGGSGLPGKINLEQKRARVRDRTDDV